VQFFASQGSNVSSLILMNSTFNVHSALKLIIMKLINRPWSFWSHSKHLSPLIYKQKHMVDGFTIKG